MSKCKWIAYPDKISAMMALASCRHSPKGKRCERRIYRCPKCKKYHLSTHWTNVEQWLEEKRLSSLDSFALSYYKDCDPLKK